MVAKRFILGILLLSVVCPQATQADDCPSCFGLVDATVILLCAEDAEVEIARRRTTTTGTVRRYHVRLEPGPHSIVVRQMVNDKPRYRVGWLFLGSPGCGCGCDGQSQESHRFEWEKLEAWKSDAVALQVKKLTARNMDLNQELKDLNQQLLAARAMKRKQFENEELRELTQRLKSVKSNLSNLENQNKKLNGDLSATQSEVDKLETQLNRLKSRKTLFHFAQAKQTQHKLTEEIRKANRFTLEVIFETANTNQSGPARLVTLSKDANNRNFTLGQVGDQLIFRLRTAYENTDSNGLLKKHNFKDFPIVKIEPRKRTHIIVSYAEKQGLRCFMNGKEVKLNTNDYWGPLTNWDASYKLLLKNEHTGDREWDGEIRLVRIYNQAFGLAEAKACFEKEKPKPP